MWSPTTVWTYANSRDQTYASAPYSQMPTYIYISTYTCKIEFWECLLLFSSETCLPICYLMIKVHTKQGLCIIYIYKVVQIWPGRFVCKQVTVCPGHIWTTLCVCVYIYNFNRQIANTKTDVSELKSSKHSQKLYLTFISWWILFWIYSHSPIFQLGSNV
jgi:hypothetical protein